MNSTKIIEIVEAARADGEIITSIMTEPYVGYLGTDGYEYRMGVRYRTATITPEGFVFGAPSVDAIRAVAAATAKANEDAVSFWSDDKTLAAAQYTAAAAQAAACAHAAQVAACQRLLADINEMVEIAAATPRERINWADVGDMKHTELCLKELLAFLRPGEGATRDAATATGMYDD